MKKITAMILASLSLSSYADGQNLLNMGYVEVNDHRLSDAGCFIRSDNAKPFFNMVSIFAANINGSDPNRPEIYFNPQVTELLNNTNQVATLQSKGIKVLLTLLGNHENSGWACMTDDTAIETFANKVVEVVNKYHLDGIDIDDEYSRCGTNKTSMIRIAKAIKANPKFEGKILSKALFSDLGYFAADYKGMKLADFLDYGWEMSYFASNFESRLHPYINYGMAKTHVVLGISTNYGYPTANSAGTFVIQNNYGGVMVYNIQNNSQNYLAQLAQAEYQGTVTVEPNCLG